MLADNHTSKADMRRHWQRKGVKGMPQWARLPYWDWAKDPLLDYMHITKNNGHRARTMMADLTENDAKITEAIKEVSPTPNMTAVRYIPMTISLRRFVTFATKSIHSCLFIRF
jgi:hypothetical protein